MRTANVERGRPFIDKQKGTPTTVALLGFGTVGTSVVKALQTLALPGLKLTHIYNREIDRKRESEAAALVPQDVVWTDDFEEVLRSDVAIVVELMGGVDPAQSWIERSLAAGKSVVTANKQVIASYGIELANLASEHAVTLLHGAAVAGGVPVIPGMLQGLSGDRITRLSGILNGTCNYILSRMEQGARFAEVLADAQRLGYAEADPVADVGGFDARAKLCILCRIAMHAAIDPEAIPTQSIGEIDAVDFAYAKELGCTIRQVSRAQIAGDGLYARVAPMLVPRASPIAWSHGTQNMVVATGLFAGDVVFSGHGAGGDATAVAVISDLVTIAAGTQFATLPLTQKSVTGESIAPHYLRFIVNDRPGIVADIAGVLAKVGANIDSLLQRPGYPKDRLAFVVTTEPSSNAVIEQAIGTIAQMDCMLVRPLSLEILVVDDKDEETA